MSPGQEVSLLVGAAVNSITDEVSSDTAVIQKSIPFCRCAIACHGFSLLLGFDHELKDYLFTKGKITDLEEEKG